MSARTIPPQSPRTTFRNMSTSQTQGGAAAFLNAVENRRTAYAINSESPIPDARIQEIVEFAVKHCPVRSSVRDRSFRTRG